jgi:glycosyltransferase involved in cell wall biosynthesis
MRVAVVTQHRDRVGGVESYLHAVLPMLSARHDLAFWSADDTITSRGPIVLPSGVPGARLDPNADGAAREVRDWRPDVIFSHGLEDPAVEAAVLGVAPAVHVQHAYHGTCISGTKTMAWPGVTPCERALGPGCLAKYFPRRCGGASPITMTSLYRTQTARLEMLRRVEAVMTLSHHMAEELRRNGVPAERIRVVPPFVQPSPVVRAPRRPHEAAKLLFLGRLEPLKGVRQLLDALSHVADRLARPVSLVVAGDGAERDALEAHAASLFTFDGRIQVRFTGWQVQSGRARLLAEADALVVPSVWPEPFGLVGLEAASAGVPAVAFAVGGIPEWLRDGENGCLAPADGARPALLAEAIARCVASPGDLARLSAGARAVAAQWTIERHLAMLDGALALAQELRVSRAS